MSIVPTQQDSVLIDALTLDASIGVFDWEKKIKQTLVFNLELYCDFTRAGSSDDIQDAVNYAQVCEEIEMLLSKQHYQLLEYLAEKICEHLFIVFPIFAIKMSIYKPQAVPKAKQVGVTVFRNRPEAISQSKTMKREPE